MNFSNIFNNNTIEQYYWIFAILITIISIILYQVKENDDKKNKNKSKYKYYTANFFIIFTFIYTTIGPIILLIISFVQNKKKAKKFSNKYKKLINYYIFFIKLLSITYSIHCSSTFNSFWNKSYHKITSTCDYLISCKKVLYTIRFTIS